MLYTKSEKEIENIDKLLTVLKEKYENGVKMLKANIVVSSLLFQTRKSSAKATLASPIKLDASIP